METVAMQLQEQKLKASLANGKFDPEPELKPPMKSLP
jgi:hypothetical protein